MTDAGYEVTIQTYKFTYYAYRSEPVMKQLGPTGHQFALGPDWNPGQSTGMTSADLQPAGHVVIPPTPTPLGQRMRRERFRRLPDRSDRPDPARQVHRRHEGAERPECEGPG
jgi:hypothetical protein